MSGRFVYFWLAYCKYIAERVAHYSLCSFLVAKFAKRGSCPLIDSAIAELRSSTLSSSGVTVVEDRSTSPSRLANPKRKKGGRLPRCHDVPDIACDPLTCSS